METCNASFYVGEFIIPSILVNIDSSTKNLCKTKESLVLPKYFAWKRSECSHVQLSYGFYLYFRYCTKWKSFSVV